MVQLLKALTHEVNFFYSSEYLGQVRILRSSVQGQGLRVCVSCSGVMCVRLKRNTVRFYFKTSVVSVDPTCQFSIQYKGQGEPDLCLLFHVTFAVSCSI